MSVIRNLNDKPEKWKPCGVPLSKMMHMKTDSNGDKYPAIVQQLVKLNDPLLIALNDVRDLWRDEDVYRCPGPIQF